MRNRNVLSLVFLMLVLGGCATVSNRSTMSSLSRPTQGVRELRKEMEYLFSDPSFSNAHWGVYIQSLDNGQILYTQNEYKGFMPASNMKLYPTAVALEKLGPAFCFQTQLFSTDARLEDGVVNGDLYVLGSGDPSFSGRFHDKNPLAPFEAWAAELKSLGIKRIQGNIIGDDDILDDEYIPESWYYSYLSEWYAAESGGLCLGDNCYDVYITPGKKIGDPVQVRTIPLLAYGELINTATTAAAGTESTLRLSRRIDTNIYMIQGGLPIDSREVPNSVTVHNTTLFFVTLLKEVMQNAGIKVEGQPLDIDDLSKKNYVVDSMKLLSTYTSPPLPEILKAINKPSQNLYADQLLKLLGAKFGKEGSFVKGYEVVKSYLEEKGIDSNGFYMGDGSGLGRIDLVQPRQTIGLLDALYRSPNFNYFYESLPIAGVDGTIRNRMKGTLAEGNVHAKTGYINRVRCLSGYVKTLDGEMMAFCMMANNYTVPTSLANRLQDQVCERLANFTRKGK